MQKAEIVHTYSNIHKSNSILNWKMGQNKRKNSNFESLKIAIFFFTPFSNTVRGE